MKGTFAQQLANRSAAGRQTLAKRLFDEASKDGVTASDRFVLLVGAMQAGEEASNLALAYVAVEDLARSFDVDAPSVKVEAALKTNLNAATPAETAENAHVALRLVDELIKSNDTTAATHLLTQLKTVKTVDGAFHGSLIDRSKAADQARIAQKRYVEGREKLKQSPDDAGANAAVGSYLCFYMEQWEEGVLLLSKGADLMLKTPASLETAKPATPEAERDLGDAWASVSQKLRSNTIVCRAVRGHAMAWYRRCIPKLSSLMKVQAQTHLAELASEDLGPAVIQFFAGEWTGKGQTARFDLTDKTLPKEFTVTQSPGRYQIAGERRSEVEQVHGRTCGHMGKSITFALDSASGSLTAAVDSSGDHTTYSIYLVDLDNSESILALNLQKGKVYNWSTQILDGNVILKVQGNEQEMGSVQLPAGACRGFGFVATSRHSGDRADLTVLIQ